MSETWKKTLSLVAKLRVAVYFGCFLRRFLKPHWVGHISIASTESQLRVCLPYFCCTVGHEKITGGIMIWFALWVFQSYFDLFESSTLHKPNLSTHVCLLSSFTVIHCCLLFHLRCASFLINCRIHSVILLIPDRVINPKTGLQILI